MDEELKALLVSHTQAMQENTLALREQSEFLTQIVAMNADLLQLVASQGEEESHPAKDLAGRPLT